MLPTRPAAVLAILSLASIPACHIEIGGGGGWVTAGGYSFDRRGESAERQESGALPADAAALLVENRFGRVEVEAAADGFAWEWEGRCWGKDQATAERLLQDLQLRVEEADGATRMRLVMPSPSRELRGVESNLTVRLPAAARVSVENEFGGTDLRGVRGDVRVESEHGGVEIRDAGGAVSVENAFGPVEVHGAGGRAQLHNEHGAIQASGLSGDAVVECSFGPVEVECSGERVRVENEHGKVDVRVGTCARQVEVECSFGPVEVVVPASVEARVSAATSFGDVDTWMDLPDLDEDRFRKEVAGGPADAPLRVTVENEHGPIRLRRTGSTL